MSKQNDGSVSSRADATVILFTSDYNGTVSKDGSIQRGTIIWGRPEGANVTYHKGAPPGGVPLDGIGGPPTAKENKENEKLEIEVLSQEKAKEKGEDAGEITVTIPALRLGGWIITLHGKASATFTPTEGGVVGKFIFGSGTSKEKPAAWPKRFQKSRDDSDEDDDKE